MGRSVCGGGGGGGMMHYDVLSRRGCLADKRGLFEGDEHGAHARHVFGLLAGLGVEVAEPGHPLPLCARVVLVQVRDHGLLGRPARNGRVKGGEGRMHMAELVEEEVGHINRHVTP